MLAIVLWAFCGGRFCRGLGLEEPFGSWFVDSPCQSSFLRNSLNLGLPPSPRFRFMELYYRRSNGVLETVVFFIPDISTCVPSEKEWRHIGGAYKLALGEAEDQLGKAKPKDRRIPSIEETKESKVSQEPSSGVKEEKEKEESDSITVGSTSEVKEEKVEPMFCQVEAETGVNGVASSTEEAEVTMEVVAADECFFLFSLITKITFLNLELFPCGLYIFGRILFLKSVGSLFLNFLPFI